MENNDKKVINYENTSEFMTFELGAMKYAIELPKIREILTYPDNITPDFRKSTTNTHNKL
mgnify:CR=1 FL=1